MKNNRIVGKRAIGFFFLIFSIMSINCNQFLEKHKIAEPCQNEESNNMQVTSNKPYISKEIAILIAKARISSDYDLKHYNEMIVENDTSWTVNFIFKPEYKHLTGGQPSVEVDKKTGEVVRWYFPK